MRRLAQPPESPPLPVGRYLEALVADVYGSADPDPLVRQLVGNLELVPPEREAIRVASDTLMAAVPATSDTLPALDGHADRALIMMALGLTAQVAHLLAFWTPMLAIGRRGESRAHVGDFRTALDRVSAVQSALYARGGPAATDAARRLAILQTELDEGLRDTGDNKGAGLLSQPIYAPQAGSTPTATVISSTVEPEEGTYDQRKRVARRRSALWSLLFLSILVSIATWILRGDHGVSPHPDTWFQKIGPFASVRRHDGWAEVELTAMAATLPPGELRDLCFDAISALNQESASFTRVEFVLGTSRVGRWTIEGVRVEGNGLELQLPRP